MKPNSNSLAKGQLLNGYRIDKTIGGGGFSLVYLASSLTDQQRVVIKEYLPSNQAHRVDEGRVEPLNDELASAYRQGIKRFFDEASALAKVHHPNIVRVENIFRANNTVYMVMHHEHGKDLRWYIKSKSGSLSEKFLRTVFPKLLLGLRELHSNQLLHLDIKPANIFLRPGGKPLLLDFGAAQVAVAGNKPTGPYTLTLGYAPIEQHSGGHLGPWTDMYAIGASMWACIAGKAPPPATERVVKDTHKSASKVYARQYSGQLLEAIDWCLQINQLDRPQSVQELLDFLNPMKALELKKDDDSESLWGFRLPWRKG
jgi:hypothetical protein